MPAIHPRVLELCAGGGGQALGLEWAGFRMEAAVEIDGDACNTLRNNRPEWRVIHEDIGNLETSEFCGVDVIAGGVPCSPFTNAGKQEGKDDARDLFPTAIDIIRSIRPRVVLLENVPGFMVERFSNYRLAMIRRLRRAGYTVLPPKILNSADFDVPQLRPRTIIIGFRHPAAAKRFRWPIGPMVRQTVGESLRELMAEGGWRGANAWAQKANAIAPTLVGGSKKHGGADLGPTRAKAEWSKLHVDGHGVSDLPPSPDFPIDGKPKLTVNMAARIQGFPPGWTFFGGKTSAYRQVGNAFPPPVAQAVGTAILSALGSDDVLLAAATQQSKDTGLF